MAIVGNHILVGLGGTGGKVLRDFKMRMFEEHPSADERAKLPVKLLYVDSTDEMMPQGGVPNPTFRVMGMDASFTNQEFVNIKTQDITQVLENVAAYPSLKGIVDNPAQVRDAIGNLGAAAGQKRRAGRLLFALNAGKYVSALRDAFAAAKEASGEVSPLYIHIFTGLCGGTGSGSIIDAIVQARKTFPEAIICVYAMLPEQYLPKSNMDQGRYYPNGYAAMRELNALQTGRYEPWDVTGNGPARFFSHRHKGVANGLTVYTEVNAAGASVNSLTELPKIIADFSYARIFYLNESDEKLTDIVRAVTYENMDDFPYEFDETVDPNSLGENDRVPPARTKRINVPGLKRVIYPEMRVLRHMTYTIAESVLMQFKYNNWVDNRGYVDEERNINYNTLFLNSENLASWMLDRDHLTLNLRVLPTEPEYASIHDFWHDHVLEYAPDAEATSDPLNALDNSMADFYNMGFRSSMGVDKYYETQEKELKAISAQIRSTIEKDLFKKWMAGEISLAEMQTLASKLVTKVEEEIKKEIIERAKKEDDNIKALDEERKANVDEWANPGLLGRVMGKKKELFASHQSTLTDYYTAKTNKRALLFARKLVDQLIHDLTDLQTEVTAFTSRINEAIEATTAALSAQRKNNKDIDDMRDSVIEVSEEKAMTGFERKMALDAEAMKPLARAMRNALVPMPDLFTSFGRLLKEIKVQNFMNIFDRELAATVKNHHDMMPATETKVLGLNILTQLQQKLSSDEAIKSFAADLMKRSCPLVSLDNTEVEKAVPNNGGILSAAINTAPRPKKVVYIGVPAANGNESLVDFSNKLHNALKARINAGDGVTLVFDNKSPRENELTVLVMQYCLPLRAITVTKTYDERYSTFLHSGDSASDRQSAILVHTQGRGDTLPHLMVQRTEPWPEKKEQPKAEAQQDTPPSTDDDELPPLSEEKPRKAPKVEPDLEIHLNIGKKKYGPYPYKRFCELVEGGRANENTLVWIKGTGMKDWTPAGMVPELEDIFAPAIPEDDDLPPMVEEDDLPPMV